MWSLVRLGFQATTGVVAAVSGAFVAGVVSGGAVAFKVARAKDPKAMLNSFQKIGDALTKIADHGQTVVEVTSAPRAVTDPTGAPEAA